MSLKHEPVTIVMRQYARPKVALKTTIIQALWIATAITLLGSFLGGVWYMGQDQDHQVSKIN